MIFISHATADVEIAGPLVDLLQLGAGVSHEEIFFSSQRGSIPNGTFFTEHILNELSRSDFVIAIVSKSYLESQFCLAEAGGALVRKVGGLASFYSLIVPPLTFSDLNGVLDGRQAGRIIDQTALSELREAITPRVRNPPSLAVWDQKRESFLRSIAEHLGSVEADELLRKINLRDLYVERSTAANHSCPN